MKKNLLILIMLTGITSTAQVKVGSNPTTINTTTTNFQVEGTTTADQFVVLKNGNVGIGTTTPGTKLDVNGGIRVKPIIGSTLETVTWVAQADGTYFSLLISGDGSDNRKAPLLRFQSSNASEFMDIGLRGSNNSFVIERLSANILTALQNGNVGIGTTTPAAKLDVNGTIKISGGTPGAGKVLTSDADGLASWTTPAAAGVSSVSGTAPIAVTGTTTPVISLNDAGVTNAKLADNAVTSAKIADGTIATADIAVHAVTIAKLPFGASPTNFLRGDGTWVVPTDTNTTYTAGTSMNLSGTEFQRAALTGDVTAAINSNATTISDNAVTSAKIADGTVANSDLAAGTGGIYKGSGSLSGATTVTQGTNNLEFAGAGNFIKTGGNLGIGTSDVTMGSTVVTKLAIDVNSATDATALAVTSANSRRIALNANTNGSFSMFDGVANNWNIGITQNSGKVGIGTTAPANKLHVVNSGYNPGTNDLASIKVEGSWGGGVIFAETTNRSAIFSPSGQSLVFGTGGTTAGTPERMRITETGNIGIGTTTPAAKLDVVGQVKISGGAPGVGKVLTSDADGLASWQTNSISTVNVDNVTPPVAATVQQAVINGSIQFTTTNTGVIMKSADGTNYMLTIENGGVITVKKVTP